MAWLYRQGEHFQLAQDIADIILVGFDILVQAETGTAAFDKDRRKSGAGGVVIGTAGCKRTYHIFHPKMLVKDILTEPLKNFGLIKNSEVDAKAAELLEMVELPAEFKDRYPHSMSGGQRQRLGIARALALEPKIIVCDEATSALDVSVQEKICELLCRIQKEKNITYLFIAHDLGLVDLMCHQVAVMYLGNVVEWLEHGRIAEQCKHPYTKALMGAVFKVDFKPGEKIEPLEGEIPSPLDLPPGCPFASRCEHCTEHCVQVKPELKEVEHGHWVACHLFD